MRASEEEAFREYAVGRSTALLRTAYLLCGDWHRADDLVSVALVKLYAAWGTASRAEHLDAYVRKILVRCWLDERRRPWRRERPAGHTADLPVHPVDAGAEAAVHRMDLADVLARMPRRQRLVLVLRFYEDQSIEATAALLGCTPGAVKSLTLRALATARDLLPAYVLSNEENL